MANHFHLMIVMKLLLLALPMVVVSKRVIVTEAEKVAGVDWMTNLPDGTLIKDMSIPGSHDTLTSYGFYDYGSSSGWPKKTICNDRSITDILQAGLRSLDFRFTEENTVEFRPKESVSVDSLVQYFEDPSKGMQPLTLKSDVRLDTVFPSIAERYPTAAASRGATLTKVGDALVDVLLHPLGMGQAQVDARYLPVERQLQMLFRANRDKDPVWAFSVNENIQKGRHGKSVLGSTFPIDIVASMKEVESFLKSNPGEFVIVQLKNEMKRDFFGFAHRVVSHMKSHFPSLIHDWEEGTPRSAAEWASAQLGALRGKVVFMPSDDTDGYTSAANGLQWQGRFLFKNVAYPEQFRKSNYKLDKVAKKLKDVTDFYLEHQDLVDGKPLAAYAVSLNTNAAAAGAWAALTGPEVVELAEGVNKGFAKFIADQKVKATGLVTFDFPLRDQGPTLVKNVLGLNF